MLTLISALLLASPLPAEVSSRDYLLTGELFVADSLQITVDGQDYELIIPQRYLPEIQDAAEAGYSWIAFRGYISGRKVYLQSLMWLR